MKYKLWWLPNQEFDGSEKEIGIFDSHVDALKNIEDFFKQHGIEIPYMREWREQDSDITLVDYSSHLHYYAIERLADNGSND